MDMHQIKMTTALTDCIQTNLSLSSPIRTVAFVGSWVECGCGELVLGRVHVGWELDRTEYWVG